MKKLALILPIVVTILGCAPMEQSMWHKQGASRDDFARDRYACLQQSQQGASSAYVNAYAGRSNSGSITNGGLFDACMNASGWYLGMASSQPAVRSAYQYSQKLTDNNLEICARNNANSDEIAACMKRLDPGANNR